MHVPRGYDGSSPLPTLLHFPGLYETPAIAELFDGCATTRTSTDLPDTVVDNTTVTRHAWQQCPDDAPVEPYDVVGGGHTWPGGIPFLPPPALGWHNYDISANTVIWHFVSRFTLP